MQVMAKQHELEQGLLANPDSTVFSWRKYLETHGRPSISSDSDSRSRSSTYSANSSDSRPTTASVSDVSTARTSISGRSSPGPQYKSHDQERDHRKTEEDIKAAMASHIVPSISCSSPEHAQTAASAGSRSISELDALATSMVLSKDESEAMEVDGEITAKVAAKAPVEFQPRSPPVSTRPHRAQSCGSKRPFVLAEAEPDSEEEKRRRVDEAMVVEEAVNTGVIMPSSRVDTMRNMISSAPDLKALPTDSSSTASAAASAARTAGGGDGSFEAPFDGGIMAITEPSPAVFGHIVKTSDTHPIIISPFFPSELLSILAHHLVLPQSSSARSTLYLSSAIDVPSLLLSQASPIPTGPSNSNIHGAAPKPKSANGAVGTGDGGSSIVPSPSRCSYLRSVSSSPSSTSCPKAAAPAPARKLGNLLLSSCPGKRLRMDGPVKGRGPVCRDLKTDLRRIKNEGVGCLVW